MAEMVALLSMEVAGMAVAEIPDSEVGTEIARKIAVDSDLK